MRDTTELEYLAGVDVMEFETVELQRNIPSHLYRCVTEMIDYYLESKGFDPEMLK